MDCEDVKCWSCQKEKMIIVSNSNADEYYVCLKCNPDVKLEEYQEGCLMACHKCKGPVPMGIDKDYECGQCGCFLCQCCIVWSETKTDEYEEDEYLIFCSDECRSLKHEYNKDEKDTNDD